MTAGDRLAVGLDVSAVPDDPRGAGRYIVELVRHLAARGAVDLKLEARRNDVDRWTEVGGVVVDDVVPASRIRRLAWEQLGAPRFVDGWGIDVFHAPHYTMPEVAKAPKVVTIHDLTFFDHPEWHEKVKVAFFKRAIRTAVARADALVCVSEPTARRLHELLDPQQPVHAIPHGVDHDRFRAGDQPDDADLLVKLAVDRPYLAFLGTLEPRKNVPALVAAFEQLAARHLDLTLVLAGGTGWGSEPLEKALAASPVAARIRRLGYVDDAAVPALLRHAAAVVYPSFEEGFGLPALEALACGAPMVTTTGSVMDEIAEGTALTAAAGDPAALAAAIDRALRESGTEEGRVRRAAGLAIAQRYTWDATAARHEDVYREVAGARRSRR